MRALQPKIPFFGTLCKPSGFKDIRFLRVKKILKQQKKHRKKLEINKNFDHETLINWKKKTAFTSYF